jgi:hypothetical protein
VSAVSSSRTSFDAIVHHPHLGLVLPWQIQRDEARQPLARHRWGRVCVSSILLVVSGLDVDELTNRSIWRPQDIWRLSFHCVGFNLDVTGDLFGCHEDGDHERHPNWRWWSTQAGKSWYSARCFSLT